MCQSACLRLLLRFINLCLLVGRAAPAWFFCYFSRAHVLFHIFTHTVSLFDRSFNIYDASIEIVGSVMSAVLYTFGGHGLTETPSGNTVNFETLPEAG